jgi:tRNA G18 (ribose-2'-O)-methylase SpoU
MRLAVNKQDSNDKYTDSETNTKEENSENKTHSNTEKVNNKPTQMALRDVRLDKDDNVIIVLGSESSGMTSSFKDATTHNIYIPPQLNDSFVSKVPYDIIDSLNVGVSAGIIINHFKSQLKSLEETLNNKI